MHVLIARSQIAPAWPFPPIWPTQRNPAVRGTPIMGFFFRFDVILGPKADSLNPFCLDPPAWTVLRRLKLGMVHDILDSN
jgi:hypothetical protein